MKNYKVFVSVNVAGTITVDAESADDAKDIVDGMAGSEVLLSMVQDEYTVYADDAEENEPD